MSTSPSAAAAATTYAIELTPPGRAAVAVVLVAGPDSVRAVAQQFTPATPRAAADFPIGRILLGRWNQGGEELIICRRDSAQVEIHCHGGAAAVRAVVDSLTSGGCHEMHWKDWLQATSADPLQAAARIGLADALTARTAGILLDQFNGALAAAIRDTVAAIATTDWPRAAESIDRLLNHRDLGVHLTTPWRIVFAGAPNVGKSSLINALAGYERAIVAPTPGTTRDVVTVLAAIDGWPVQLADTAGIRTTTDALESAGIELAHAALAAADLAILVRDTDDWQPEEGASWSAAPRSIHIRNKIDLLPEAKQAVHAADDDLLFVSALTGVGLPELVSAISKKLVSVLPASGAAIPFTAKQVEILSTARAAIEQRHAQSAINALQSLLSPPHNG